MKKQEKMTNYEHVINAYTRQQEEKHEFVVAQSGGVKPSKDYIVVHDDKAYTVKVRRNTVVGCNCPHHTYRGVVCKHMVHIATIKGLDLKVPAPKVKKEQAV